MKGLKGFMLITAVTVFFSAQVLAQETPVATESTQAQQVAGTAKNCPNFTDNDNNGICDNFEKRGQGNRGANFVDKDGNGVCDHRTEGMMQGKGGKDCPRYQQCCKGQVNCCGKGPCGGKGQGMGHRHRHGCGGPCGSQKAEDRK